MSILRCAIVPCLLLIMLQVHAQPKNFIVIMTDDQRYQDLGCFGSKRMRTPNIDQYPEMVAEMKRQMIAFDSSIK